MLTCNIKEESQNNDWYLDSFYCNQIYGNREIFSNIHETTEIEVKMENNSGVPIMGK